MKTNKFFSSRYSALALGVAFGASALFGGMSYAQSLTIPSNLENAVIAIKSIFLSPDGTSTDMNGMSISSATIHLDGTHGDITTRGKVTVGETLEVSEDTTLESDLHVLQSVFLDDYRCPNNSSGGGGTGPGYSEPVAPAVRCILMTQPDGLVIQDNAYNVVNENVDIDYHSGDIRALFSGEIRKPAIGQSEENPEDIYFGKPASGGGGFIPVAQGTLVRIGMENTPSVPSETQLIVKGEMESRQGFKILSSATPQNNTKMFSYGNGSMGTTYESRVAQQSGKLRISHKATTGNPIIYFDGSTNQSVKVGINTATPTEALQVNGKVRANSYLYNSDRRYKSAITPLSSSLKKILALKGYSYYNLLSQKSDIGIIAQDVEKVFPELVQTDAEGYKSVEYGNLVAPLIEAVKELNHKVETQEAQLKTLEKRLQALENN